MIYTQASTPCRTWDPERVYQRLYDVLTGKDTDAKFARLSADDRRNILEILRDTKPGLPATGTAALGPLQGFCCRSLTPHRF